MNKDKLVRGFILSTMIGLYVIVSLISTLHVITFFEMSNPRWLAISLAVAFEIGAAASLASIIVLEKTSKFLVWSLFLLLTAMQMQGNMFYAYINLQDFQGWIELFGLQEEELITQKRILSFVSGAILPIIALGFIKSLVDYLKPEKIEEKTTVVIDQPVESVEKIEEMVSPSPVEQIKEESYSNGYKEAEPVEIITDTPAPAPAPIKVNNIKVPPKEWDPRPKDPGSSHYGGSAS
jgi:hypothetical protein